MMSCEYVRLQSAVLTFSCHVLGALPIEVEANRRPLWVYHLNFDRVRTQNMS